MFLAIGKAFSILSEPKKREQYDQYGHAMEPQYHRSNGGGRSSQNYYYDEDDDEFSAEEIFNLFFGYSGRRLIDICYRDSTSVCFALGPTSRTYRRRQQPNRFHFTTHSTHHQTQNVRSMLFFRSFSSFFLSPRLEHSYTCTIITLFISLSYLHYRYFPRQ